MKITDMVISAILKKGILYEARNVDVGFEIPTPKGEDGEPGEGKIKIQFKAEHMSVRIEKE